MPPTDPLTLKSVLEIGEATKTEVFGAFVSASGDAFMQEPRGDEEMKSSIYVYLSPKGAPFPLPAVPTLNQSRVSAGA